jgi:hypothetical protein
MEKDCGDAIFITKEPAPDLSDISQRLERVRKKLAVLAQLVGQRK